MAKHTIDINCDIGESYYDNIVGNDDAIFPYITSCNIACGFHGGDPYTIEQTIHKALESNVQIGAHPSYPDLEGFGRRSMKMVPDHLKSIIKYQVVALKGLAESNGGQLMYVKPHGALYHDAAKDVQIAAVICEAVREIDPELMILGLAGSTMQAVVESHRLRFIPEAFADRRYLKDGTLTPRMSGEEADGHVPGVISVLQEVAEQVLNIIKRQQVVSTDGSIVPVSAKTICIHGDHQGSPEIVKYLKKVLEKEGIAIKPFKP